MLEITVRKRWPAKKCLAQGFKVGLFKRRVADGFVVCASDPDDLDLPTEEGDDGTKTPTAALSPQQTQAGIDREATIIQGNLWEAEDRQVRTEASHPRPPTLAEVSNGMRPFNSPRGQPFGIARSSYFPSGNRAKKYRRRVLK